MSDSLGSRLLQRQSELSLALAAMFFSGGVFSGLAASVFPAEEPLALWLPILFSGILLVVAGVIWLRGRRVQLKTAAVVGCAYLGLLTLVVATSASLARATVASMLSVVVIVFFAWFLPTWFARIVGYMVLALFALAMSVRYPTNDSYLTVVAVVAISVLLTEVFGRFRTNLERSSLTDHLCGVWNRRGFEMLLDKEIRTVARTQEPLAVIFIDLDGFKDVNDARGHHEGDLVLQRISAGLESGVRSGDSVARVGGDEFVLLLPRTSSRDAAVLAERLQGCVTACDWSFGIAQYEPGETAREFIQRSDAMMMTHKRERRGDMGLRAA